MISSIIIYLDICKYLTTLFLTAYTLSIIKYSLLAVNTLDPTKLCLLGFTSVPVYV